MKRFFKLFIPILAMILLGGCIHFKVNSNYRPSADDIRLAEINNKTFVIHSNGNVFYFNPVAITNDSLTGLLEYPTLRHDILIKKPKGGRYRAVDKYILDEVHLYVKPSKPMMLQEGMTFTVSLTEINKIDTYSKNHTKDAASVLLTVAAIPVTAFAIVMIAWLIDPPDSCPYVYVQNSSGSFDFVGEIFGGSIYAPLERHDYMAMPDTIMSSGNYTLLVSNELREIQYINLAELMLVSHDPSVIVLPDRSGNLYTFSRITSPVDARSMGGNNLMSSLSRVDKDCFRFDEQPEITGDTSAFNSAILTFNVPSDASTGKLIIRAGNQMWGDYQISQFTKLFGNKYDNWIRRQRDTDGSMSRKWKHDQKLYMDVCIKTDTGWKYIDYFELTGPMGRRDLVMPVSLTHLASDMPGKVQLKLTSGFMFWEMDYAGMDFTVNAPVSCQYVKPVSAVTETGKDVVAEILTDNTEYYIQKETGERSLITYQLPEVAGGLARTIILHSKGYYEHVRDYKGKPDVATLLLLSEPGKFSLRSAENYKAFTESEAAYVIKP